jgi:hypothetical protein
MKTINSHARNDRFSLRHALPLRKKSKGLDR